MEYDTITQVPDTMDYLHDSIADATPKPQEWQPLSLDSIFAAWQPQTPLHHQSLFTAHSLQPSHTETLPRATTDAPSWIFGVFFIIIALFSLYLNSFRVRLKGLFGSAVSLREMGYFFRDNNFKRPITIMPMMLLYAGVLAMCILYCAPARSFAMAGMRGLLNCLSLFGVLVLYFLVKNGLISMLGNIFYNSNATRLYNSNNYIYQFVACFLLLPLQLIAFYSPANRSVLITLLVIIVCFFFIMRLFRGMKLILTNATSSKFYLFYYLCIVETVPLLVLGKQFITL